MSDIQSDAAPNSTEPSVPAASVEEGQPIESGSTVESTPSADTSIPSGSEISSAGDAGNTVEAGSAAPGEALPNGTPADSGTNPGSSGPVSTESEAGNVDNLTAALNGPAMTDMVATAAAATVSDLPRESHLMLLEHKLAMMRAKFMTGERIVVDEFEQILGHIRAVL